VIKESEARDKKQGIKVQENEIEKLKGCQHNII